MKLGFELVSLRGGCTPGPTFFAAQDRSGPDAAWSCT
jgi:hypothetical protein